MGFFARVRTLVFGKANDTLDRMENKIPEPLLNQYIRDMDVSIRKAHEALVRQMAFKVRIENSIKEAEGQIKLRLRNAEDALGAGEEDLAYRAMSDRLVQEENVGILKVQLRDAEEKLMEFNNRLTEMREERDRMLRQKDQIVARSHYNVAMTKMDTVLRMTSSDSAIANFDRIRDRVENASIETEARLQVREQYRNSGNKAFEELARKGTVQKQLDELKLKLQAK